MYTIKKAFIEIDIDEYLEKLSKYQGYIDASDSMREPNDIYKVDSFESLKHAEREIDTDVVLIIDSDQAVIEYQYIEGSEKFYFTHVIYENKRYPIDDEFYSESCYRAILKNLDLDEQPKNLRESKKVVNKHGPVEYGRFTYDWYVSEDTPFEMTDELHNSIQKLINKFDYFYVDQLAVLLSDAFDADMKLLKCKFDTKCFTMVFTGRKVCFGIDIFF